MRSVVEGRAYPATHLSRNVHSLLGIILSLTTSVGRSKNVPRHDKQSWLPSRERDQP